MSKSSKKGVILFAKGTQTVGGAIGLYGAYVAFSTGPAPEPVTKGTGAGLLLIGAAVGFVGLATEFVAELVDPFDPAFKRVARAVPVNAPRIGAGAGIPKAVARAINRLAMNAARVDAYGDALLTAYNRAASATKRDDLAARSRQLRAAARFARSLAKFLDADPALRRRLSQAIRAAHLSLGVNPGRLPQIRRSLRRGPPPFLRSVLRTFGLNKAEIRDFTRQIANVKLGSPLPRVTSLLANKRIAAAEHRAANGFREVARAFDAAA